VEKATVVRSLFLIPLLGLAACTATLALPVYPAASTDEIAGNVLVNDFTYAPRPGVGPNQIRDTAFTSVNTTEQIGSYFTNAVRRELRQSGVTLREGTCILDGTIRDFAAESLGFEITYVSEVTYRLARADGSPLMEKPVTITFKTSKFRNLSMYMSGIGKSISDNISVLLKSPDFRSHLDLDCSIRSPPRRANPSPRPAKDVG
jgi:hypothetical protein